MKGAHTNDRSWRIWTSFRIAFIGSLYSAGHHSDWYLRYLTDRVLSGQPVSVLAGLFLAVSMS
jgi:hypothetical protein